MFRIGYNIGYGLSNTNSAIFCFEAALIFMESNSFLSVSVFFATPITLAIEKGKITKLSLLVYNTHGLPTIFAKDRPRERFPEIVRLTHDYDISLLQEDFAHHDLVLKHAKEGQSIQRGEGAKPGNVFFALALD